MVSDNGKTFKGAAKVLSGHKSVPGAVRPSLEARVEWSFNIERAPWWGGFFERLVQSTKRCLKKVAGRSKLLYEELITLTVEIEAVINSRPLSFVSSRDLEEPLTPSHLLVGRRLLNIPDYTPNRPEVDEDYIATPETLSKRVQFLRRMVDGFWDRWRKEYLMELRSAHASRTKSSRHGGRVRRGDVVVVHDDNQKRGFWRLGLVEDLLPGRDEQIRGARVRVSVPGRGTTIWRRPVERLYPLEVSNAADLDTRESVSPCQDEPLQEDLMTQRESGAVQEDQPRRPRRQAAKRAQEQIHHLRNLDLV